MMKYMFGYRECIDQVVQILIKSLYNKTDFGSDFIQIKIIGFVVYICVKVLLNMYNLF